MVKNDENRASVYNIEELCDYIEKELIQEQEGLQVETKNDQQLDLNNVSLGFNSDSENEEQTQDQEGEEHSGRFIDQTKEAGEEKSQSTVNGKEEFDRKIDFLNEESDLKSMRMFEDAKDYLLEAAENLNSGIQSVNFLK